MSLVNKAINSIKNLKNMNSYEIVLFVLLILYIVGGVSTPYAMSPYVNNIFMYASLLAIAYLLYLCVSPLLVLLFVVAAIVLVQRSKMVDFSQMKPTQQNKNIAMNNLNKNTKSKTLEEEMVGQIEKKPDNTPNSLNYHPVMCDAHNATTL